VSDGAATSYEVAGFTDIGPVREENEDAWDTLELSGGRQALLLADGMGGHPGGGEAADAAVAAAAKTLGEASPTDDPKQTLANAVHAASRAVAALAPQFHGAPGTTLVIAIVADGHATVANVGDSRAYLIAGSESGPITQDHSWVYEQMREGRLTADSIRRHPRRNVITRAVMGDPVEPDLFTVELTPGAVLMLASDGVWEPLEDPAIAHILQGPGPMDVLVERLCRSALDAGGTDNATAVALREPSTS